MAIFVVWQQWFELGLGCELLVRTLAAQDNNIHDILIEGLWLAI